MQNPAPRSPDTIAAVATAPGRGGVGVVRVSGAGLGAFAFKLCGREPKPRTAHFTRFLDADERVIDEGILLYFAGPASFTGEDVLELQGHGGPVVGLVPGALGQQPLLLLRPPPFLADGRGHLVRM